MSPRRPLFKLWDYATPKLVATALFFLVIIGYALFRTSAFLRGPELAVTTPTNYQTVHNPLVIIEGEAERISHLYLNRGQIYTDEHGRFDEKLLLAPGYNIITVEAKDKFGRHVKQTLELVYN